MPEKTQRTDIESEIFGQKSKWPKVLFAVMFAIVMLAIAWQVHNREGQLSEYLQQVNAGVLYDGQLGRALRQSGYVEISDDAYNFGGRAFCAGQDDYSSAKGEYRYTVLITAHSNEKHLMYINLGSMEDTKHQVRFVLRPGLRTYSVGLKGPKETFSRMRLWMSGGHNAIVTEVWLDGFLYPRIPIYLRKPGFDRQSKILDIQEAEVISWEGHPEAIDLSGENPYVDLAVPEEKLVTKWQNSFFQRTRKNSDCQYSKAIHKEQSLGWLGHQNNAQSIDSININIDDEDLNGAKGLKATRDTHRGHETEKRAKVSIFNGESLEEYDAGMRFHGGGPGRKKIELESFRLYFRNRLARPNEFFGFGQGEVPRLVLKYTKVARIDSITDSNPFSHAFALDIARSMQALVPRSRLVNLHINGEHRGLYLAMDHLSERTFEEWLGTDSFFAFVYKRPNSRAAEFAQGYSYGFLLRAEGEEVLKLAREMFDMDNLLNSMVMSAYIGDDDFCQGVDLIRNPEPDKYYFTIVNWDLDHGFTYVFDDVVGKQEEWKLSSTRPMRTGYELCSRLMFMRHIYHHSVEFRSMYRQHVEKMFNGPLAKDKLHLLLDRYRQVNADLNGKYDEAINTLARFIDNREAFMLKELTEFEQTAKKRMGY